MTRRLLSVRDVQRQLGVRYYTARQLVESGQIASTQLPPADREGRATRANLVTTQAAIDAYLARIAGGQPRRAAS